MTKDREKADKIILILKKKFNNLSALELVNLALDILEAVKES